MFASILLPSYLLLIMAIYPYLIIYKYSICMRAIVTYIPVYVPTGNGFVTNPGKTVTRQPKPLYESFKLYTSDHFGFCRYIHAFPDPPFENKIHQIFHKFLGMFTVPVVCPLK